MTTTRDLLFLVAAIALLLCVSGAVAWQRQRVSRLLTTREWRIAGKILASAVLLLVLVLTHISQNFPAELLIYGRF